MVEPQALKALFAFICNPILILGAMFGKPFGQWNLWMPWHRCEFVHSSSWPTRFWTQTLAISRHSISPQSYGAREAQEEHPEEAEQVWMHWMPQSITTWSIRWLERCNISFQTHVEKVERQNPGIAECSGWSWEVEGIILVFCFLRSLHIAASSFGAVR